MFIAFCFYFVILYVHNSSIVDYGRDFLLNNFAYNGPHNKLVGSKGPVTWPARSPDLNHCDFFLWGWVKNFKLTQGKNLLFT